MADDDHHEAPKKSVSGLARFFEAQMPTVQQPVQESDSRRISVVSTSLSPPHSTSPSRRTSVYERAGVPAPFGKATGNWGNAAWNTGGTNLSSTDRFRTNNTSASTSLSHLNGSGSPGDMHIVSEGGKRTSVTRLSQLFESGLDIHNQSGQNFGSTMTCRAGPGPIMLKAGSVGNISQGQGRFLEPDFGKPRQPALIGAVSADHLPSQTQFDKPFRGNKEAQRPISSSNDSIEVPETIPVRQRIASITASLGAGAATIPQPSHRTSIYNSTQSFNASTSTLAESSRSNSASTISTFKMPAPPTSMPTSPAFKRAKPPVAPSPAAVRARADSSAPAKPNPPASESVEFQPSSLNAHGTIIMTPDPRNTHSPAQPLSVKPLDNSGASDVVERDSTLAVDTRSPTPTGDSARATQKRDNIVRELISTEKAFLKDMEVLMDVYALPASQLQIMTEKDMRVLFSNLDVIIPTSRALLELFEAAASAPDQWIGEAFNQMMRKIESAYCEYCKHNEAAMVKLTEYASPDCPPRIKEFLKDCQAKLQGRTGAWDLGSLVIKPVQRVLKYPLLVKQLLKETPPDHPDFEQLCKAAEDVELVAEKINEVKKRKDIVEKYVDGKGNVNVIHGITKKWTRGTQQLKKATGLAEAATTSDALYEALAEKMEQQFNSIQQLSIDLQQWLAKVKQLFELQGLVASALEDMYELDPSAARLDGADNFFAVQEYRKACARFSIGAWRDAENQVKTVIQPALDNLTKRFRDPQLVMRKREKKLLDYERAMAIRARGEPVEKMLSDSAEAYSSLHAQLVEELPRFLDLVAKYIDVVSVHIADLQARLHADIVAQLEPIVGFFGKGSGNIVGDYHATMIKGGKVESLSRDIAFLVRWRDYLWGSGEPIPIHHSDSQEWDDASSRISRAMTVGSRISSEEELGRPDLSRTSTSKSQNSLNMFQGGSLGRRTGANGTGVLIDINDAASSRAPDTVHRANVLGLHLTPLVPTYTSSSASSPFTSQRSSTAALDSSRDEQPPRPPPRSPSPPIGFEAVAVFDFEAASPEEVNLKAGDRIRVLEAEVAGGEWWFGIVNENQGWFPGTYVERVGP